MLAALNALAELPAATLAKLDLRRVYLCGHSAGAHLALWLGYVSRSGADYRAHMGKLVGALAGPDAAQAMQRGVAVPIGIVGVACLAPVTSLTGCAYSGLSDFHDAALNFLWRLGPGDNADAMTSGQLAVIVGGSTHVQRQWDMKQPKLIHSACCKPLSSVAT